jgi:hypothetical protein
MKGKFQEDYADLDEKENAPSIPRFVLFILIAGFIAFAYLTFSGTFNNEKEPINLPETDTRSLDFIFMDQITSAENQATLNEQKIHDVSGDLMNLVGNVNQIESNLDNAENKLVVLETEIGAANERIRTLESNLSHERLNVSQLTLSLQDEQARSSQMQIELQQERQVVNDISNDLQFFMLAAFTFGLMLVICLISFAMVLFYSLVRQPKRPFPSVHYSQPTQQYSAPKTALPHPQQPQVISTPVVISRKTSNLTGYEPVITSYNGRMASTGIALPLDSVRPPTEPEAQYMRQMSERGASKNSICSAFYGGKNSERMQFVTSALNGEY